MHQRRVSVGRRWPGSWLATTESLGKSSAEIVKERYTWARAICFLLRCTLLIYSPKVLYNYIGLDLLFATFAKYSIKVGLRKRSLCQKAEKNMTNLEPANLPGTISTPRLFFCSHSKSEQMLHDGFEERIIQSFMSVKYR